LCLKHCPSGTYLYTNYCLDCPSYCLECLSSSQCTLCLNSSYYLGSDTLCHSCTLLLPHCLTCSVNESLSQYNCSLCAQGFFRNSSLQCYLCSAAIPNCLLCSTSTLCSSCISTASAFQPSSNSCLGCGVLFLGCQECGSDGCTLCAEGMMVTEGGQACECNVGEYVSQLCVEVVGCTSAQQYPGGSILCLTCDSSRFHATPVNNTCQCLQG
jgi:proprotein convertase subtilisin/kexin type 5